MKRAFLGIALTAFALTVRAQQPDSADIASVRTDSLSTNQTPENPIVRDTIWEEATADDGVDLTVFGRYARNETYYQQLVDRFEQADTTLRVSDLFVLYYGYAYRDEYHTRTMGSPWSDLVENKQYAEAYTMICELLEDHPACLYLLDFAIGAGYAAGRPTEELDRIAWRLFVLMEHIYMLRDGSKQTPFIIVDLRDNEPLLYRWLKVKPIRAKLRGNRGRQCYCVTIETEKKDSKVWFDVTLPWLDFLMPYHWSSIITQTGHEKN